MRFLITTLGSLGDLWPFFGLASELRTRGHSPIFACKQELAGLVRQNGFDARPVGAAGGNAAAAPYERVPSQLDQLRRWADNALHDLPEMVADITALAEEVDVLLNANNPATKIVHERTGMPYATIKLWHFIEQPRYREIMDAATRDVVNAYREREGLPIQASPLTADLCSEDLSIYAVSRHVDDFGPLWSERHHVAGFMYHDQPHWAVDEDLAEFIADGEPPLVVSFGSLLHEDPRRITEIVFGAVRRSGRRAVIQHGWGGLATSGAVPEDVFTVGFVPHEWLFSRASCIVHAGSAGVTASTARAGKPAVVVPHILDQPLWAELMERKGCARVVPCGELREDTLAAAITDVVDDQAYRRSAAELARLLADEDGVARIAGLVTEAFASERAGRPGASTCGR